MNLRPALLSSITIAAAACAVSSARAEDTKEACVSAYEQSQLARRNGDLSRARQELRLCARAACPALVRNDCVTWLEQVEEAFPSIVIRADRDGADVVEVRVVLDERPIATHLDGRAIELAPGEHLLRFELEGAPPVTQTVLVREGEKARPIAVHFPPSRAAPPSKNVVGDPGGVAASRPTPFGVYLLGAVGLVGAATFGVLASLGKGDETSLRDSCAPDCSRSAVESLRTEFLVGDVALGVGTVSLAAAALWYILRPGEATSRPAPVDVAAGPAGARITWTRSF